MGAKKTQLEMTLLDMTRSLAGVTAQVARQIGQLPLAEEASAIGRLAQELQQEEGK